MSRCKHTHTVITWLATERGHEVFARHCATCDFRLSIGDSNDAPVAVEIRAAELAATYRTADEFELGVQGHGASVAEWNGYVDRETDADLPREHEPDKQAGWLAHAIHAHGIVDLIEQLRNMGDTVQPELVDEVPDSHLDGIDQSEPVAPPLVDLGGES